MIHKKNTESKLRAALREYMNANGVTMQELADMIKETHWQCRKVSVPHINKYLRGAMPGVYIFMGICEVIGETNPYNLMEDSEPGSDTIR